MEWVAPFSFLVGGLILLIVLGFPVAFAFLIMNVTGGLCFMGGMEGAKQLSLNTIDSLASFSLTPVPLFILMGEILFRSGIAFRTINVIDKFFGRVPGRLSIVAIAASTFFSSLTGSAISNTAILGSTLLPEMKKRGYSNSMAIGPIVGTGGLAMMIPPSALAVILGSVSRIPIGGLLIGGITPGLMMAAMYTLYITVRCTLDRSLAPGYDSQKSGIGENLKEFLLYVMPLFSVVFLVVGQIYLGIATPTEAAATGCVASVVLAACYKRLNGEVIRASLRSTIRIACMTFLIIAGSVGFSQVMAFSGAGTGFMQAVLSFGMSETLILVLMLAIMLVLGCFMDQVSMIMITVPIYVPIIKILGVEPVWFGIMILIALDIGFTSPPFGLLLFVMKGIAPEGVTMGDIYRSAVPFILINVLIIILILAFPEIVLYLPRLAR